MSLDIRSNGLSQSKWAPTPVRQPHSKTIAGLAVARRSSASLFSSLSNNAGPASENQSNEDFHGAHKHGSIDNSAGKKTASSPKADRPNPPFAFKRKPTEAKPGHDLLSSSLEAMKRKSSPLSPTPTHRSDATTVHSSVVSSIGSANFADQGVGQTLPREPANLTPDPGAVDTQGRANGVRADGAVTGGPHFMSALMVCLPHYGLLRKMPDSR
jgi:hypothetical protein